jgi:threonine aldolase
MAYAPLPAANGVPVRANLYSDTQTRPSPGMKAAMMEAEVGDEQMGADPTINALCERMAALLGKPAAMFLPTGTMCNQIALLTHCRPGDEVLAHETAHIISSEGGAPGALGGVQVTGLQGADGQFDPAAITAALREQSRYSPPQVLLEVEQTANFAGGTVWPLDRLNAVADLAHAHGMRTHMDGARLMNAVVATGVPASEMVAGYDSVWLDFTKGLGAPLGAVLAGSAGFIDAAWRWKQRLGGSLRQGGMNAAACLYALDHNIDRLADDHAQARLLARELAQLPTLTVQPPETNLVYIDTSQSGMDAEELAQRVRNAGVLISVMGRHRARACTHLDVTRDHVLEAAAAIRAAVG